MRVFINPGHNPDNPTDPDLGAGAYGVWEADIVKEIAPMIADYVTKAGVEVVGIYSGEPRDIVYNANNSGADLFVSLHCNSVGSSPEGTETFYCEGSKLGRKYASIMQKQLVNSWGTVDRGVKGDTRSEDGSLYVLRHTSMPAILIEIAFITNEKENDFLVDHQDEIAQAIARGITDIGLEM